MVQFLVINGRLQKIKMKFISTIMGALSILGFLIMLILLIWVDDKVILIKITLSLIVFFFFFFFIYICVDDPK